MRIKNQEEVEQKMEQGQSFIGQGIRPKLTRKMAPTNQQTRKLKESSMNVGCNIGDCYADNNNIHHQQYMVKT